MTQQYDNRGRFVLYRNDRKEKDSHPDYRGSYTDADGVEYWLDGWIKSGQRGSFISGQIKVKTQREDFRTPAPQGREGRDQRREFQRQHDAPPSRMGAHNYSASRDPSAKTGGYDRRDDPLDDDLPF